MGGVRRKDIDGSEGVPSFYGKELRWKREQAGLTLAQLTEGSFYGLTHLSEIERGERRMPRELADHVDRVLETDGFFARRCEDVRNARRKGHAKYFERVLESERHADSIEEWCPTVFPGLLQTEPYIRGPSSGPHTRWNRMSGLTRRYVPGSAAPGSSMTTTPSPSTGSSSTSH